ncbi:MAG: flagellar basal-body rod protein FlgF [Alphaproteobacteria bacterium]
MENASYIALSLLTAVSREMDIVANNVANANTPAFRGEGMLFVEHLADLGASLAAEEEISFVEPAGMFRSTAPGPMTSTANPLDVAINGEAYFVVETPDGPRYTRSGHFRLDAQGQIVTQSGLPVLSAANAPITLTPEDKNIVIARDGMISTENGEIDRLNLVRFADPQALRKLGDGLYDAAGMATEDADDAEVVQGMVEGSNVQPVLEITRMIALNRIYQMTQKLIEKEDQLQQKMIDTLAESAA